MNSYFTNKKYNKPSKWHLHNHTTITLFLLWLMMVLSVPAFAQFDDDYIELKATGRIPNEYLNLVRGSSRINFKNTERLNRTQKETFRDATNLALRAIFTEGSIYYNDPLTDYVRTIGAKLMGNGEDASEVEFYVSKSYELNASSWQTGTIIINIGLLSRLQNEAQLAYVLAHEIAHFKMQHPYKQYARQIKGGGVARSSELARNFREHFDYSLIYELEADSMALEMMKKSGFEVNESISILKKLLDLEKNKPIDLVSYFSSPQYKIQNTQLCDHKAYGAFKKASFEVTDQHFADYHIQKRLVRVETILERDYKGKKLLLPLKRFQYDLLLFNNAVSIARFEVVSQAFQSANYLKSIYEALQMLPDFPENKYLHAQIAENLFYIGQYDRMGLRDRLFFDSQRIGDTEYAKLYCLFSTIETDELQQLVHGFIEKKYRDYPGNPILIITAAKSMEINQPEVAKDYFKKYVKYFPYGKHYTEAKLKANND